MPEHLLFVWSAFHDLSGDRAIGFGAFGPIPFLAIDRYAERYGIACRDEFDRFATLIRAMDRKWRKDREPPPTSR